MCRFVLRALRCNSRHGQLANPLRRRPDDELPCLPRLFLGEHRDAQTCRFRSSSYPQTADPHHLESDTWAGPLSPFRPLSSLSLSDSSAFSVRGTCRRTNIRRPLEAPPVPYLPFTVIRSEELKRSRSPLPLQ